MHRRRHASAAVRTTSLLVALPALAVVLLLSCSALAAPVTAGGKDECSWYTPPPPALWPDVPPFPDKVLFVKTPKCAGSTVAGVIRSVAARRKLNVLDPRGWVHTVNTLPLALAAAGLTSMDGVDVMCNHLNLAELYPTWLRPVFGDNDRWRRLRVSIVRHPVARAWSGFWGGFCREKDAGPSVKNIHHWMHTCGFFRHNAQFRYLRPVSHWNEQQVLEWYDVLLVQEHMVESMLVLMWHLHADWSDVLLLAAKDNANNKREGMQTLNASTIALFEATMAAQSPRDLELWKLAKQRILRQYDALPASFKAYFAHLRAAETRFAAHCGTPENHGDCFWRDNGCGRECSAQFTSRCQRGGWLEY